MADFLISYDSADDSGSDIDNESQPILSHRGNLSLLQEKIDKNIKRAVTYLSAVTHAFMFTVVSFLCLFFISLFLYDSVPLYAFCIVAWTGHIIIFFIAYKILRRLLRAIGSYNEAKDLTLPSKHRKENVENRIQIILFVVSQIFWILSLSLTVLISEVLVLLNFYNLVPAYAFTLPLYVNTGFSLLYALFFRSVNVLETLSILLLLDCLLLYSTHLSHEYTINWDVVFSPLVGLFLVWLCVFIYIAACHLLSIYRLKAVQLECLFLYVLGLIGFTSTTVLLMKYLNSSSTSLLRYFAGNLLVSSISFLMAFNMDVAANIAVFIDRFGAYRPKVLKEAESGGGWVVDLTKSHKYFTFLGEIDMFSNTSSYSTPSRDSSYSSWLTTNNKANSHSSSSLPNVPYLDTTTTNVSTAKTRRNPFSRRSPQHWLGDSSSDDAPSPIHHSPSLKDSSSSPPSPVSSDSILL